jgi:hypothetical protein
MRTDPIVSVPSVIGAKPAAIAAAEMCAYLFEYDSVFGPWRGSVHLSDDALVVNGTAIPLYRTADISGLDLAGVDVVMERTGRADTRAVAERGLRAGARRVLVSGPSAAADVTVVLGVNEATLTDQAIVSNAFLHDQRPGPACPRDRRPLGHRHRVRPQSTAIPAASLRLTHLRPTFPDRARRLCRWCQPPPRRSVCWT